MVNHMGAYVIYYLFHLSPEKVLGWEMVTWVNWLGLEPSAVWISLPAFICTYPGSSHLPRRIKRQSKQICPYISVNLVYFVFNVSIKCYFFLAKCIFSNSAQWSEPFLLLLNIGWMCSTAWRTESLGRVHNGNLTLSILFLLLCSRGKS